MIVYAIVHHNGPDIIGVESIWSTRALAKAAIQFYAAEAGLKISDYRILKRELNVIKGRRDD